MVHHAHGWIFHHAHGWRIDAHGWRMGGGLIKWSMVHHDPLEHDPPCSSPRRGAASTQILEGSSTARASGFTRGPDRPMEIETRGFPMRINLSHIVV
jgi:hypothetical protein